MSQEHEPREAELRINEQDRETIKQARNEHFDGATPMGFVARYACEQLVDDADANSGGIRL